MVVTDDSSAMGAAGAGSNDGRRSPSSGDDDALVIAVAPTEKKSISHRAEQLLPPRPVHMMEPRPLHMTRIMHHHPGADNSETDSADEVAASGGTGQSNPETPSHILHHPGIIRSNGSIQQVRKKLN